MKNPSIHPIADRSDCGTLMWIGDHRSAEFSDAFDFCEAGVSQLAIRRDIDDALARPAQSVQRIILTRRTRQPRRTEALSQLSNRYRRAHWVELHGPLCEVENSWHPFADNVQRCLWHQWQHVLPSWLRVCGVAPQAPRGVRPNSVAVVAASLTQADPLMDLIVACGASAVWCREPDNYRVRGIDAVWWDDSVVGPSSSTSWRERITSCDAGAAPCQHIWLVSAPRLDDYQQAQRGGVSMVVGKPFDIDALTGTLVEPLSETRSLEHAETVGARRHAS